MPIVTWKLFKDRVCDISQNLGGKVWVTVDSCIKKSKFVPLHEEPEVKTSLVALIVFILKINTSSFKENYFL